MTVLVTILSSFVTITSPRYPLGVLMPPTLATGVQKQVPEYAPFIEKGRPGIPGQPDITHFISKESDHHLIDLRAVILIQCNES